MVCAKAIATMIPIAMPVSSVSREMDIRVFPGVRERVKKIMIIAQMLAWALDSSRVEEPAMVCEGDCDYDSIAMPVSSVSREFRSFDFTSVPRCSGSGIGGGITRR